MIPVPAETRIWVATGHTDTRKGFDSLAVLVQDHLKLDPFSGQAFVFRGHLCRLVKILWGDGQGPVCSPSGSRVAVSLGRRPQKARPLC